MAIIVERVSRQGQVLQTQVFDKNAIRIGRAYTNDFVLTDPHVEAQHLLVEFDPASHRFTCYDVNTLNGSYLIQPKIKLNKHKVAGRQPFFSGQMFSLGRTFIRIYSSDHSVAAAQPLSRWEEVQHFLSQTWVYSTLILAFLALSVFNDYLTAPTKKDLLKYVLNTSYALVVMLVYAGFWAFVGKNLRHDAKFTVHLSVAAAALLGIQTFDFILPYLAFNLRLGGFADTLSYLYSALFIYFACYVTLVAACQFKPLMRTMLALVLPILFCIPMIRGYLNTPDFWPLPKYDKTLVAPAWQMREVVGAEEFISSTAPLYQQAQENTAD